MQTETGTVIWIRFQVCREVQRVVLSVGALVEQGVDVHFTMQPHFSIDNVKVKLRSDQHLYFLDARILKAKGMCAPLPGNYGGDIADDPEVPFVPEQEVPVQMPLLPQVPKTLV